MSAKNGVTAEYPLQTGTPVENKVQEPRYTIDQAIKMLKKEHELGRLQAEIAEYRARIVIANLNYMQGGAKLNKMTRVEKGLEPQSATETSTRVAKDDEAPVVRMDNVIIPG